MSKEQKPATRMVKLDPEVHEKVNELAGWLGIEPGELVAEAVVFYLDSNRDELSDRIQARVTQLFNNASDRKPQFQPVGWAAATGGWGEKKHDA